MIWPHQSLTRLLRADGYKIVNTLVTDLVPDRNVLRAMNDIETKKRERAAAQQAAEAKKVMVVMAAEAEKEARKLNGQVSPTSGRPSWRVSRSPSASSCVALLPLVALFDVAASWRSDP